MFVILKFNVTLPLDSIIVDLYNEYVDATQFSLETCWYKYNLRHKRYTKFELNRWRYTTSQGWSFENWHPNTGMQLATIKPGMVQIPWHHYFGNYQPQQESIPAVSCCTVRLCVCVCVCVCTNVSMCLCVLIYEYSSGYLYLHAWLSTSVRATCAKCICAYMYT